MNDSGQLLKNNQKILGNQIKSITNSIESIYFMHVFEEQNRGISAFKRRKTSCKRKVIFKEPGEEYSSSLKSITPEAVLKIVADYWFFYFSPAFKMSIYRRHRYLLIDECCRRCF